MDRKVDSFDRVSLFSQQDAGMTVTGGMQFQPIQAQILALPESVTHLQLVLGDQLHHGHHWWQAPNPDTVTILMECRSETDYVRHHVQKVVGFFLAMRHFAAQLRQNEHQVLYLSLDDSDNQGRIADNMRWLMERLSPKSWAYQLPDEYRLDEALNALSEELAIPVEVADTEHFLAERDYVQNLFAGKKQYLMETFYRRMRRQYNLLMEPDGKTPLTGRWNYDAENRKKLPKKIEIPATKRYLRNVNNLVDMIHQQGVATIGTVDFTQFDWPVTRAEGLDLLQHFLAVRLHHFGDYQDAMTVQHELLFHSRLSFVLNVKLLTPLEVVEAAIKFWEKNPDSISISTLEGFVRQIIGWREYMRGIYWAKMPDYAQLNFFGHKANLPKWYWTGETKMRCLNHAITQSLESAYAHHIQRLMVTGAFGLLLGVHPDEMDAWYLGIYMDALEWVEITNTRGMSQFADGGIVGTKPYVGSANYIHKMGDYCTNCSYDRKAKIGPNACPFNSLYWDFYDRHRDKLGRNPRIGMMYRVWDKRSPEEKTEILERAAFVKEHINDL